MYIFTLIAVNIFENNLNLDQPVTSKEYTKNILPSPNNQYMDGGYQSISGERINWGEMQNLILQVAAEMDMDARRAMRGLMKDNEIRERLTKLKDKKKNNTNGMRYPMSPGFGVGGRSQSRRSPRSRSFTGGVGVES